MNALTQNEYMPLPSSFLLFASSSFLSLALNASSAFAEIKTKKISALILCLYHKWKYWGKGKEIPYIFFVKLSEEKKNWLKIWNIPFTILFQNFRIFTSKLWSLVQANFCIKRQMNLSSMSLNNGIWTGESFWSSDLSVQCICLNFREKFLSYNSHFKYEKLTVSLEQYQIR